MLASDFANPEFSGAKNPDSGLFVEFYWHEPVDAWASREQSQLAQKKVVVKGAKTIYCRIMVPGDKQTIWEEAVREHHKQRFPREWMAWQISEGLIGGDGDIPGWKLSEWPELTEDQVRELLHLRFQTVEQLAGATDRQLQGIGMGGVALKEKARVALRNRMGAETREALEAERAEKEELKARLEKLEALLLNQAPAPTVIPTLVVPGELSNLPPPEKRGPGRPPKDASL
jgi:hypothetical protein